MSGRVWQCRDMGAGLSTDPCPVLPTRSDPVLAGLPRDSDYSLPCYCLSPSPSHLCSLDHGKCDKYWGSLRGCSRAGELGGAECSGLALRKPSFTHPQVLPQTRTWTIRLTGPALQNQRPRGLLLQRTQRQLQTGSQGGTQGLSHMGLTTPPSQTHRNAVMTRNL